MATALNANLKRGREKVGELIKDYGKLLGGITFKYIGNITKPLESIGEMLSSVDVEELKNRIEKIINESQKRIVIFIDDIDRLEKNEIHSVFRLVKLTADFSNTTYILSFDEKMIAAAIGERFGEGN